jgi:hypothetical protein
LFQRLSSAKLPKAGIPSIKHLTPAVNDFLWNEQWDLPCNRKEVLQLTKNVDLI